MSSVSHRRAASFSRLLQMMVVGQDLHQEVQLQSLRLKGGKWSSHFKYQSKFQD